MKNTIVVEKQKNIRHKLASGKQSPFQTYKDLTVGAVSASRFIQYELLTTLLGPFPGGAGFLFRKMLYPKILGKMGKGVIIGRNVTLRHPGKVCIGDHVTIDDNSLIDARGAGKAGFVIEDNVLINRNCMLLGKNGPIRLGARTSLGSNNVVVSMVGVDIGEAVLTAGGCYISAGTYEFNDLSIPVMDHPVVTAGPITIGRGAWLGSRATVLDGVEVGAGAIVGAGALVMDSIPDNAIAVGVPAKVIRMRP
jgi:acetyltransferase-like isoleucine patch superfamily enzyme